MSKYKMVVMVFVLTVIMGLQARATWQDDLIRVSAEIIARHENIEPETKPQRLERIEITDRVLVAIGNEVVLTEVEVEDAYIVCVRKRRITTALGLFPSRLFRIVTSGQRPEELLKATIRLEIAAGDDSLAKSLALLTALQTGVGLQAAYEAFGTFSPSQLRQLDSGVVRSKHRLITTRTSEDPLSDGEYMNICIMGIGVDPYNAWVDSLSE